MESICGFLQKQNVETRVFGYNGMGDQEKAVELPLENIDFVITLGGDGTVLFAARQCSQKDIPVFPINLGEFGFLAAVDADEWQEKLQGFLDGNTETVERTLIESEVIRGGKSVWKGLSMNDLVLSSSPSNHILNFSVAYNKSLLGPFKANGIIAATSTGSTAFSAAAGGPIIDPSLEAVVLTPISSFSLSARPLVFSSDGELAITVLPSRVNASLSADGQINFNLEEEDVIIIKKSKNKVRLVCASQLQFYSALRSKLNWSGGPRA